MNTLQQQRSQQQIANWLLVGVVMIIIQVLIGGITRLTESGLSITEWKPITGTLPPLNEAAWQAEFDKYKVTDQFKYVHKDFTLSEFKFIFFWEWFHRVWARLMGLVFLFGFIYFLAKRKFDRAMIKPMIILFILGGLQGFIGWIMVKSGLVPEKYFVGHVELTTHFIAALGLLCYTLWFALSLKIHEDQLVHHVKLRQLLLVIFVVLFFQLIYGGFMAGMRAAITAPTWPDINGAMVPAPINELQPLSKNFIDNPLMVHFIHRALAYLLVLLVCIWFFRSAILRQHRLFNKLRIILLVLIFMQAALGIATVLNATNDNYLVVLGVSHQFVAMLIVIIMIMLIFLFKKRRLA